MDVIVGQQDKVVMDESRTIQCGTCRRPQSVQDAITRFGSCPGCQELLCVMCGCTERAACVRPGAFNCTWLPEERAEVLDLPSCCDFCFYQIAEFFYLVATSLQPKPFAEPARALVI